MNGSYGAFATKYFILFNEHVSGTITAQGRDLTKTMSSLNEDYWYNQWHIDYTLHNSLGIINVTPLNKKEDHVSVYADTDSVFVSFDPAIRHCTWKNLIFNDDYFDDINEEFLLLSPNTIDINSNLCISSFNNISEFLDYIKSNTIPNLILIDGSYCKDRDFNSIEVKELLKDKNIKWNWSNELDFIHGIDYFKYANYFKDCLDKYAAKSGVENKQDFELERISESVINVAKKKYIQHIVYEDGINHDKLSYIYPKGVELVRSSTPAFAREKIIDIVKYLFAHPSDFNIKDLLKLVKNLRREFELADIDDISMQSSCSKYEEKVLNDKDKLEFVTGTHFAVKCSAYYNFLLHKNSQYQQKYEFIKSGHKIKYYYCKNTKFNEIFGYIRGSYPLEFGPEVNYDVQFEKSILSPINSIIEPLGLPMINQRLSVILDIFSTGF